MQQSDCHQQRLDREFYCVAKRKDAIIHVYLKPNMTLDMPLQDQMLSDYMELTGGEPHLFITEAGEYVNITKEAREYAKVIEHRTPVLASVVLVQNPIQKLMASFYIKFNKPKKPLKLVRNFQDGIDWLHAFKEQHQHLDVK